MRMHAAIIEDDRRDLEALLGIMHRWQSGTGTDLTVTSYTSGASFLEHSSTEFDLVIISVQLADTDGIGLAERLRSGGYSGDILLLSGISGHTDDGYHVRALAYLMKPVCLEALSGPLQTVLRRLTGGTYLHRHYDTYTRIPYSEILYFMSSNQYVEAVTASVTLRQIGTLQALREILPPGFVQCHRSFLVNMDHVVSLKHMELTLDNGSVVPVSRSCIKNVRSRMRPAAG